MIAGFAKVVRQVCAHTGMRSRRDRASAGRHGILSTNSYVTVAVVGLIALVSFGCVASSRRAGVPPGSQVQGYGPQAQQQPEGGLIKPYIPATPGASDETQPEGPPQAGDFRSPSPSQGGMTGLGRRSGPAGSSSPSPAATSEVRNQWESQKVKAAAIKLAKTIPTVIKIKVCYAVENDEWWVILYDDHGPLIDLKQYTWNREKLELQPFLVLKQISKNQLERHLTRKTSGRACEILDYPSSRQLL